MAIFESSSGLKDQNTPSLGHRHRWLNEPSVAPRKGKTTWYGMVHRGISEWSCPFRAIYSHRRYDFLPVKLLSLNLIFLHIAKKVYLCTCFWKGKTNTKWTLPHWHLPYSASTTLQEHSRCLPETFTIECKMPTLLMATSSHAITFCTHSQKSTS